VGELVELVFLVQPNFNAGSSDRESKSVKRFFVCVRHHGEVLLAIKVAMVFMASMEVIVRAPMS